MKENLFNTFNTVSAKAWKQKIQMDLNGVDYNKTLVHQTNEGIHLKPFYHHDDFKRLDIPKGNDNTKICQTIFINDVKKANNIAREALQKGADTILFVADKPFDIEALFKKITTNTSLRFVIQFLDKKFITELQSKINSSTQQISIDVIHHFTKEGNWFLNQVEDFEIATSLASHKSGIDFGVDVSLYQNSGATISQQIAYALAHFNEYLNAGLITNSTTVSVKFGIGSNYFFEIAKIRAFRYLMGQLLATYDLKVNLKIIAEPSTRNKTIYDYNVNLLRTTTECMSAILAGADMVSNTAYDHIYHRSNEFGSRIARNQLLILKEESYFMDSRHASNGSYYIEQLTFELAEKSLLIFKEIEKNGGFIAQLKKGSIQRKIEDAAKIEQQQFDSGELVLLGTNKYPNNDNTMKNELELYPFVKTKARKTIIKPIIPRRLSEKIDQKRLQKEE